MVKKDEKNYQTACQAVLDDISMSIFKSGLEMALKTAKTMCHTPNPGHPAYDTCLDFLQRHGRA